MMKATYKRTNGKINGEWSYIGTSKLPAWGISYENGFGYYEHFGKEYKFEA